MPGATGRSRGTRLAAAAVLIGALVGVVVLGYTLRRPVLQARSHLRRAGELSPYTSTSFSWSDTSTSFSWSACGARSELRRPGRSACMWRRAAAGQSAQLAASASGGHVQAHCQPAREREGWIQQSGAKHFGRRPCFSARRRRCTGRCTRAHILCVTSARRGGCRTCLQARRALVRLRPPRCLGALRSTAAAAQPRRMAWTSGTLCVQRATNETQACLVSEGAAAVQRRRRQRKASAPARPDAYRARASS